MHLRPSLVGTFVLHYHSGLISLIRAKLSFYCEQRIKYQILIVLSLNADDNVTIISINIIRKIYIIINILHTKIK